MRDLQRPRNVALLQVAPTRYGGLSARPLPLPLPQACRRDKPTRGGGLAVRLGLLDREQRFLALCQRRVDDTQDPHRALLVAVRDRVLDLPMLFRTNR